MLKKIQSVVINLTPSDPAAAVAQRRAELDAANEAVGEAEVALQSAHDSAAADSVIAKCESMLASAKLTASRAESRYIGAENRLRRYLEEEASRSRAADETTLADLVAERARAAASLDNLAAAIAVERAKLQTLQTSMFEVCQRLARSFNLIHINRAVELCLFKTGALDRSWSGDPADIPSATDLICKLDKELVHV